MSSYRKNLMVGVTMIAGLFLLAFMIIKFGDAPARLLAPSRMTVYVLADRADGLSSGSSVTWLGVDCGTIDSVRRSPDQKHVVITVLISDKNPPPANIVGRIRSQFVGGGSMIAFELSGPEPQGTLAAGAHIQAQFVGIDVLPPAFGELASELELTARQLRTSGLIDNLNGALSSIHTQIDHAGKLMDDLQKTVGDEKMRGDLQTSMANFRDASESARNVGVKLEKFSGDLQKITGDAHDLTVNANVTLNKAQEHVDELSKQMNDRLEQVARLLETFQSISGKVDKGQGTAGQLVNDPKLYQALVDSTRELETTIKQLNLLIEQWKGEGVTLKLK